MPKAFFFTLFVILAALACIVLPLVATSHR
jgi:hypothetical protein